MQERLTPWRWRRFCFKGSLIIRTFWCFRYTCYEVEIYDILFCSVSFLPCLADILKLWFMNPAVINLWESSGFGWGDSAYRERWMCLSRDDHSPSALLNSKSQKGFSVTVVFWKRFRTCIWSHKFWHAMVVVKSDTFGAYETKWEAGHIIDLFLLIFHLELVLVFVLCEDGVGIQNCNLLGFNVV